jgi:hypothetical protein
MRAKYFVINQAVKKQYQGIKGGDDTPLAITVGYLFHSEEDARIFLARVIKTIKSDIKYGLNSRPTWSLDPEKWLDFAITEATLEIPEEKMLKKNWKLYAS